MSSDDSKQTKIKMIFEGSKFICRFYRFSHIFDSCQICSIVISCFFHHPTMNDRQANSRSSSHLWGATNGQAASGLQNNAQPNDTTIGLKRLAALALVNANYVQRKIFGSSITRISKAKFALPLGEPACLGV